MRYFALFFLFISLVLSSSPSLEAQNKCLPKQVRLLIGDAYYSSNNNKISNPQGNNAPNARIMFQTIEMCLTSQILLMPSPGSINIQNMTLTNKTIEESKWNTTFCHNTKGNCQNVIYDQFIHDFSFFVQPEQYFQYSIIGDTATPDNSSTGYFQGKMPPMVSNPKKPLEFIYFGDVSLKLNGDQTLKYLNALQQTNQSIDAMLFLGDYAYEFYQQNGTKGDDYLQKFEDVDTYFPLAISAGNHEDNFNFLFYNQKFHFPLFNQTHNNYYSFNTGPVHFLALNLHYYNNETGVIDELQREKMLAWVEADLLNANSPENRAIRPWIIVFGHQPIYCLNYAQCGVYFLDYQVFDSLLYTYSVDLFLGAHDHSYQFMGPMYQNKSGHYSTNFTSDLIINPDSTVHVIQGNGGCETMDPSPYFLQMNPTNINFSDNQLSGLMYPFRNQNFIRKGKEFGNAPSFFNGTGIGQIIVYNETTLLIQSIDSITGQIVEKFTLVQNKHSFAKNIKQDRQNLDASDSHLLISFTYLMAIVYLALI